MCRFGFERTAFDLDVKEGVLKGLLTGGRRIESRDSVWIVGVGIRDGVLRVNGTQDNDHVSVSVIHNWLVVHTGFPTPDRHSFGVDEIGSLQIEVVGGNDVVSLARLKNAELGVIVRAGAGNDLVIGSRGDDILLGGSGHDVIFGGSGDDIIIGGFNSDLLLGNNGQDLIIGGTTAYDDNDEALFAIRNEWTNTHHGYESRVANVNGDHGNPAFASRRNGQFFLRNTPETWTVFDDGAVDVLFGGFGRDWFFFTAFEDWILGKRRVERVN